MKLQPMTIGTSKRSLLGPAFIAGVAYLDPGNVATNLTAGSAYGYSLLWVIVFANLAAWVVQYLAAKLGYVSSASLPELVAEKLHNKNVRRGYWAQAQLVAIATDVAEVIGGAIALYLLFDLPLMVGAIATALFSIVHLYLRESGRVRIFEGIVYFLIALTAFGFAFGIFSKDLDFSQAVQGLFPRIEDSAALLLIAGIIGATIMPHAIYAHSALSRDKLSNHGREKGFLTVLRWDVTLAMLVAGAVNMSILLLGAINLYGGEVENSIVGAHEAILSSLGSMVATFFAIGLLASGAASSSVGTYASTVITQGLLHKKVPLLLQRSLALGPALVVVAVAPDPTMALVLSQVVLSLGIPFALFPLVYFTSQARTMGDFQNSRALTVAGTCLAVVLTILDLGLIVLLISG